MKSPAEQEKGALPMEEDAANAAKIEKQSQSETEAIEKCTHILEQGEETIAQEMRSALAPRYESLVNRRGFLKKAAAIAALLTLENCTTRLAHELAKLEQPPESEAQEPPAERKELMQRFHDELRLYKALGFDIQVENGVVWSLPHVTTTEAILQNLNDENVRVTSLADPLQELEIRSGLEKELPPEFRTTDKITINPLHVTGEADDEKQHYSLRLNNWITQKELHRLISSSPEDIEREQDTTLLPRLQKEFSQKDALQKIIDELTPDKEAAKAFRPAFEIMTGSTIAENDLEGLRFLCEQGSMAVNVIPEGAESDRILNAVPLRMQYFEKTGFRPIGINGRITEIIIDIPFRQESAFSSIPGFHHYLDPYNNRILFSKSFDDINDYRHIIYPKTFFGREIDGPEEKRPLRFSIDRGKGFEDFGHFLYQRVEQPLAFLDKEQRIGIYSNMNHENTRKEFGKRFPDILRGIQSVEYLFGLPSVKEVYIGNSRYRSAFFYPTDSTAIYIQDELLHKYPEAVSINASAAHETAHQFDELLDISHSNEMNTFYHLVARNNIHFLRTINEGKFLPHCGDDLGHAEDNGLEFFASFINSFQHPQWEKALKESDIGFQKTYLLALRALESSLANIQQIPRDAPIFTVVQEKIAFCERLSS